MTPEQSNITSRRRNEIQIPDFLQGFNSGSSASGVFSEAAELTEEAEKKIMDVKAVQAQVPNAQKKIEEAQHMEALKREVSSMSVEQQQEIAKCLRYGVMFRELQSTMLALAEYADATRNATKKLDGVFNFD